jgi:hypothetical protein
VATELQENLRLPEPSDSKNMVMSPVGLGTKNHSAGEGQQKFSSYSVSEVSRDSAVGIATGCGLDGRGGRNSSPGRGKIFLLFTSPRPALGSTQPPVQ